MSVVQPSGYYTHSSYWGILPDGTKREFVSDTEYYEVFEEEVSDDDE